MRTSTVVVVTLPEAGRDAGRQVCCAGGVRHLQRLHGCVRDVEVRQPIARRITERGQFGRVVCTTVGDGVPERLRLSVCAWRCVTAEQAQGQEQQGQGP